jgi:hypothetical protein
LNEGDFARILSSMLGILARRFGATTVLLGVFAAPEAYAQANKPPLAVWQVPLEGVIASPTLHLKAKCDDENPSTCVLKVTLQGCANLDLTANGVLDRTVDLSAATPGPCNISLSATDELGQWGGTGGAGGIGYCVWAAPLDGLTEVARSTGTVHGFTSSSLLFNQHDKGIGLDDRAGGPTTYPFLRGGPGLSGACEYTPSFASSVGFYLGEGSAAFYLNGSLDYASAITSGGFGIVEYQPAPVFFAHDMAAFIATPGSSYNATILDLKTGVVQTIVDAKEPFISSSGRVFFTARSGGGVFEWTPTGNVPTGGCASGNKADDVHIVCGTTTLRIVDLASKTETTIDTTDGTQAAVQGGWIAFPRATGPSGTREIWTRSPAGDLGLVTGVVGSATIEALGSDGRVALKLPGAPPTRWIGQAGSTPLQVNPYGTVVWRYGHFYVVLGRSLFRITSSCTPGDEECKWVAPPDDGSDAGTAMDAGARVDGGAVQDGDVADMRDAADDGDSSAGAAGASGGKNGDASDEGAADARSGRGGSGGAGGSTGAGAGMAGVGGRGSTTSGGAVAGGMPDDQPGGGGGCSTGRRGPNSESTSRAAMVLLGLLLSRRRRASVAFRERGPFARATSRRDGCSCSG